MERGWRGASRAFFVTERCGGNERLARTVFEVGVVRDWGAAVLRPCKASGELCGIGCG